MRDRAGRTKGDIARDVFGTDGANLVQGVAFWFKKSFFLFLELFFRHGLHLLTSFSAIDMVKFDVHMFNLSGAKGPTFSLDVTHAQPHEEKNLAF